MFIAADPQSDLLMDVGGYVPYALLVLAGFVLMGIGLVLSRGRMARCVVPASIVAGTAGLLAGIGLGFGAMHALGYGWVAPYADARLLDGHGPQATKVAEGTRLAETAGGRLASPPPPAQPPAAFSDSEG